MSVELRSCAGQVDFPAISDFLYSLYQPDNRDGNWLQPIWEYAYTHPCFDEESVSRIGIWEDNKAIVGVVLYQSRLGEASLAIHPDYVYLKPVLMAYAEQHLTALTDEGKCYLKVYVKDFDVAFERLVKSRGYERQPRSDWALLKYVIPEPFPAIPLPEGFRLKSIAEENDLAKIDRVLWRGFDHPGEPPEESIEDLRSLRREGQKLSRERQVRLEALEEPRADRSGELPLGRVVEAPPKSRVVGGVSRTPSGLESALSRQRQLVEEGRSLLGRSVGKSF